MPKFSIVTPTFNSATTVSATVQSVIQQSFNDYEHIIIDNASTDNTLAIVTELYAQAGKQDSLKIVSEKDKGISDAFNKGIIHASGTYILIVNSDDKLHSPNVLKEVDRFSQAHDYKIIHGDMVFVDETFGSSRRAPLFCSFQEAFPYNHPGMFVHRDLYAQYGMYRTDFKVAMDFELLLRYSLQVPGFSTMVGYCNTLPLAECMAGGVSWNMEQKSIDEVKRALILHNQFTAAARYYFAVRTFRIKLKAILRMLHLESMVKVWRRIKWGN